MCLGPGGKMSISQGGHVISSLPKPTEGLLAHTSKASMIHSLLQILHSLE